MDWSDLNLLDIFSNPKMLHAAAAHFPVALAGLGLPLVILAAIIPSKSDALRWLCLALYLVLAACAFAASVTGENALESLNTAALSGATEEEIAQHAKASRFIWILGVTTAVLCALSLVKSVGLRRLAMLLTFIASVATFLWVGHAAKTGDELIYVHGVGTPGLAREAREVPVEEEVDPGDEADAGEGDVTETVPDESPEEIPEDDEDYPGTPVTEPSGPPSVMPGQLENGADEAPAPGTEGGATRVVPEEPPSAIPEEDEEYSGTPATEPAGPPSVMPGQLEGGGGD